IAMAVWDVPDDRLDVVESFACHPKVTLCYRRPRHLPIWPYNIFCMVHARSRWDAYSVIDEITLEADTGLLRQAVLFSKRCFKQRGAVISATAVLAWCFISIQLRGLSPYACTAAFALLCGRFAMPAESWD